MEHGSCIHFNGVQNDLCKRGVRYAQFHSGTPCIQLLLKSASGGTLLRPGEAPASTKPFPGALPKERCPFYEEPSEETVQADRREWEEVLKRHTAGLRVASKWRVRPRPSADRREVVECPVCAGRLHLSQSSYNGHVHGRCETEGCLSWME